MAADHPRSRGVYTTYVTVLAGMLGSSPLARGLQRRLVRLIEHLGIIPARAGFTDFHDLCFGLFEDHPRSRGVYVVSVSRTGSRRGSSPLARGLL